MLSILFLSLLLLLLLSEPLSVSAEGREGVQIYVSLIFFGMILTRLGHTDGKKQPKARIRRKSKKDKRAHADAQRRAILCAIRYLIPRATLLVECDRDVLGILPPIRAGIRTSVLSALYALFSLLLERVELSPIDTASSSSPPVRATVRVSLLDALIAAWLFASAYIKRKDSLWHKRK